MSDWVPRRDAGRYDAREKNIAVIAVEPQKRCNSIWAVVRKVLGVPPDVLKTQYRIQACRLCAIWTYRFRNGELGLAAAVSLHSPLL